MARALAAPLLLETAAGAKPRSSGRRLTNSLPIGLRFAINGARRVASLTQQGQHRYEVEIEGRHFALERVAIGSHSVCFTCGSVMDSAVYSRDGARLLLRYRGQPFDIEDRARAATARQEGAGGGAGAMSGAAVVLYDRRRPIWAGR